MRTEHERWMAAARDAARHSNCIRRSVGAVIVRGSHIVSAGWNGVTDDLQDCRQAGCPRCITGGQTGQGYENCMCMHAEQRAIARAARLGVVTDGASIYINLRPCLSCLSTLYAAGITDVVYDEDWVLPSAFEPAYAALTSKFRSFVQVDSAIATDFDSGVKQRIS